MADDTILRSFLVRLGFTVKNAEQKKFEGSLTSVTKEAIKAGAAVTGIGLAAHAMVKSFASEMERLYYVSKRTGSSVDNIQALESGARRVGLEAGQATEALEQLSMAMKLNPGKRGLLDSLTGGKTKGMEDAKAIIELVKSLQNQPFYVGAQFAEKFGMDAKTFQMLSQSIPQLEAAEERRLQLNKELGINAQKLAEDSKNYKNQLRDINEQFSTMSQLVTQSLLPAFKAINGTLGLILKDFVIMGKQTPGTVRQIENILAGHNSKGNFVDKVSRFLGLGRSSSWTKAQGKKPWERNSQEQESGNERFSNLEKQYGLPSGLLDSMWKQESGRGKNMHNKESGAEGHFQFIPKTQKEFGLRNPYDLNESSEAAAKKMKGLLGQYNGSLSNALAAYNYGQGNLSRVGGLGNSPAETKNYVKEIQGRMQGGITIKNDTIINISGATSPSETAREVKRQIQGQNSEAIRNVQAKIS